VDFAELVEVAASAGVDEGGKEKEENNQAEHDRQEHDILGQTNSDGKGLACDVGNGRPGHRTIGTEALAHRAAGVACCAHPSRPRGARVDPVGGILVVNIWTR